MFTRDVAPIDEWNFYGQHPFIICVNDDHVFAIYMHNSNAQEFVLSPKPGKWVHFVVLNSTGSLASTCMFFIYFFASLSSD